MVKYECSECDYEGTSVTQMRQHAKTHPDWAVWWKKGERPKGVEKPVGTAPLVQAATSAVPSASSGLGALKKAAEYIVGLVVFFGIIFLYNHSAASSSSVLSSTPQLNSSWVTQFFGLVGTQRHYQYSECSQLDSLAALRYNLSYLNYNETILAPLFIETLYGGPTSSPYGVTDPSSYLQDLLNNYTGTYGILQNQSYLYYGYFIYGTTGKFGTTNITARTQHVFVELAPSCG